MTVPLLPPSPAIEREPFLYLYGCDPYFDRVDMTTRRATGSWNLREIAPDQVLPVEHTDGCAIHTPVFEPRSGRMFVAAPQTSSEGADGHRYDSIVGVQLPSFEVTDVIGADWALEDPVSLLVTDDSRLMVSNFRDDAWPGVGNGFIVSVDVSRPGRAQRGPKTDGVSFSVEGAIYKDGTIWDEMRAVRLQNGRPTQQNLDIKNLWKEPAGAPLRPFLIPISSVNPQPLLASGFLEGYVSRALFSLHGEATVTLVVGTITPPAVRVIKTPVPSADSYLIAEGHRILVLERDKEDFTGRVITIDADTGAVRKDWHVGELELPLRYLCAHDDLLIFGREKSLLLVQEGSSEVTRIKVPRQIDTYARCLFATR